MFQILCHRTVAKHNICVVKTVLEKNWRKGVMNWILIPKKIAYFGIGTCKLLHKCCSQIVFKLISKIWWKLDNIWLIMFVIHEKGVSYVSFLPNNSKFSLLSISLILRWGLLFVWSTLKDSESPSRHPATHLYIQH